MTTVPGESAPAAPARYLRQKLKGPLRSPEIGHVERRVCGDDTHEGHIREIVTLGDHLCADEDVDLAPAEGPEDTLVASAGRCGVAVHPCDPCLREEAFDFRCELLRPQTVTQDSVSRRIPGTEAGP